MFHVPIFRALEVQGMRALFCVCISSAEVLDVEHGRPSYQRLVPMQRVYLAPFVESVLHRATCHVAAP